MHFRSIADLNTDILQNLHRIPADIDVVIGVPRSGLLPATLIAMAFNLPLADVEGFAQGRLLGAGRTKRHAGLDRGVSDLRNVLLVDDSVLTGKSMAAARTQVVAARPNAHVTTLAVYGADGWSGADIICAVVEHPRVFQWNVMHHKVLAMACVDIDGILCADPTSAENDDGARYRQFLASANALHRPTRPVHAVVTSRLEKYRPETEAWLAANDVTYDHLIMLDLESAAERRRSSAHGAFKAAYYRSSPAKLFIESELGQACEIAAIAEKPVLWLPGAQMIYKDGAPPAAPFRPKRLAARMKRTARRMLGPESYAALKRLFAHPT
jgi:hypoxanthine phosphoribosyltransferase